MEIINLLLLRPRFPVKLICCIAFGSRSSACCLLKFLLYHFYSIYETAQKYKSHKDRLFKPRRKNK